MRAWLVAAGLIEGPEGLLLVQNLRRDGSLDWSPPGGVVEVHEGETAQEGLTREVAEETGLVVTDWDGPVYDVEVAAETLGWTLRVEVYRAVAYSGELAVADPDGIVVDARFVTAEHWDVHFDNAHRWVREPVLTYFSDAAGLAASSGSSAEPQTRFRYRLDGAPGLVEVVRVHEND